MFGLAADITILTLKIKQKQKKKEELIKQQEQNRKEREELIKEQERIKEQRIIAHKNNAKEFESEIVKLIKDLNVIIDSNLWMDYEFECFFGGLLNILDKYDHILNLCGAQFDELCNIRSKPKNDHCDRYFWSQWCGDDPDCQCW